MPKRLTQCAALFALAALLPLTAQAQRVWSPQIGRFINLKKLPKETPELQVEYARSLLAQGDYDAAEREADKFDEFYLDTDFADDNQFLRGEIKMAQGDYMDAAREFQQVISGYPDSELFSKVIEKQYEAADSYYAKGQENQGKRWRLFKNRPFKKAVEIYNMVIDNQPFTAAAAEAQYKIGLCHYTRKEYVEASFEYRRVIEDYTGSDWVDDAMYGLAMCYYEGSLSAAYDQSPSMLAIRAIDDFRVQFPNDPRAEGLVAKRAEMREVIAKHKLNAAHFYEERAKYAAAATYYEVIATDFAETQAANQARQWLKDHGAGVRRTTL